MASSSTNSDTPPESFTSMDEKDPSLIGSHCQYTYCNVLDFLPFRCESCFGTFCLDHRTETAHQCRRAGEWAARRRKAQQASSPASAGGRTLADAEVGKPCARPACKTVVGKGLVPGVQCPGCNRTYCLSHRLKEEHDCKNLAPLGARASGTSEKALAAFGRLKAWGTAQKASAASRVLPRPKPSSASARLVATNALKKTAKGDDKLPQDKRVYIYVEAEAETTKSKFPKGAFFYSKDWVIGRVLDAAAKSLMVENLNNQGMEEKDRLRVFYVEGGRLLEFNEKVGNALVNGNTIVLLRGVGPAVPDLIS